MAKKKYTIYTGEGEYVELEYNHGKYTSTLIKTELYSNEPIHSLSLYYRDSNTKLYKYVYYSSIGNLDILKHLKIINYADFIYGKYSATRKINEKLRNLNVNWPMFHFSYEQRMFLDRIDEMVKENNEYYNPMKNKVLKNISNILIKIVTMCRK